MKKISTILLVFLPFLSWCQFKVSGTVIAKSDKSGIPAEILEKGTKNGTTAKINGEFELTVKDENATLMISLLGYKTKEVKMNGKPNKMIEIKEDCYIDWFDHNIIGFKLLSGLNNTPIGGESNFSFVVKGLPLIKTYLSYQRNLENNKFLNVNIGLNHLFVSCDFNADINLNYKNLKYNQSLDLYTTNLSTNLNLHKFGIIAGIGSLSNRNNGLTSYRPTLGFRTWASRPLWLNTTIKSTINKQFIETNIEIERPFRLFNTFVRFYSIKEFNELTIGIGKDFSYYRKRKKT
ncbi:MAG TPA: carboxypeptidase-like regulatory domain-containing protein [Leadbetterella sp.]|nr:carboxypeptidase-like regulatory domain-containing protein [Leadbetterella sp.]